MDIEGLDIESTAERLCRYTAREAGIAVLAHTDSGAADLFVDGNRHANIISGTAINAGEGLVRLRSRSSKKYIAFDLLGPISADLFIEMGELYARLIQARLEPKSMEEMLNETKN